MEGIRVTGWFQDADDSPHFGAHNRLAEHINCEITGQMRGFDLDRDPIRDLHEINARLKASMTGELAGMAILHAIYVTPHHIPGGWTRMYRSDGRLSVYMTREIFSAIPRQSYHGISIFEGGIGLRKLTGIPVYEED